MSAFTTEDRSRHSSTPPSAAIPSKQDETAAAIKTPPFFIGVAGGTASGKTTVCKKIMESLGQQDLESREKRVVIISQDSFYKDLNEQQRTEAANGEYNFDHPDAFDNDLMLKTLKEMNTGRDVKIPVYDFKTHTRSKTEFKTVYPADVILLEGILVLYSPEVRKILNMKIFVDTDSDTRLSRRILRDIQDRGRTLESVIHQYTTFVKPAFEDFTLPTKKYADVIIPRGAENDVAINLIGQHIKDILSGKLKNTKIMKRRTRHVSESSCLARPH